MRALSTSLFVALASSLGCGGDTADTPDTTDTKADTRADGETSDTDTTVADIADTTPVDSETTRDSETVEVTPLFCDRLRPDDCDYDPVATYEVTSARVEDLAYTDILGNERTFDVTYYRPVGLAGPLPVMLLSAGGRQGQTNPADALPEWAETFARAGYLAVAIAHPRRQPDDYTALCDALQVQEGILCGVYINWDRPHDVQHVLDWLEAPPADLVGLADTDHIGYLGHGDGASSVMMALGATRNFKCAQAYTATQDCQIADLTTISDERVDIGIVLSPVGPGDYGFMRQSYGNLRRPLLFVTGLADGTSADVANRLETWSLMPAGDKYKLLMKASVGSSAFFEDGFTSCDNADLACIEMRQALVSAALAFADAHLTDRMRAKQWLVSQSAAIGSNDFATWELK